MNLKKLLLLPVMALSLTSCTDNALDILVGAPSYTGTVVSHVHPDDDEDTDLYRVTLDKITLFNYYIDVDDTTDECEYMTVKYDSSKKMEWQVDGKTVTNHGYTFVHWGKAIDDLFSSDSETGSQGSEMETVSILYSSADNVSQNV